MAGGASLSRPRASRRATWARRGVTKALRCRRGTEEGLSAAVWRRLTLVSNGQRSVVAPVGSYDTADKRRS
jgi:hypothetical protein